MDDNVAASGNPRFEAALSRFDQENQRDPNRDKALGVEYPRELLYAQRVNQWVLRLKPDASEALLLAARSVHLCRWTIPRDSYPLTRAGYLRWRQELKKFHALKAGQILRDSGYDEGTIKQVQALVSKSAFPDDPDSRVLEDALCLVFLQWQFRELAGRSSDEKMINAVQKTWKKMTPLAQDFALKLDYSPRERGLLERALGPL